MTKNAPKRSKHRLYKDLLHIFTQKGILSHMSIQLKIFFFRPMAHRIEPEILVGDIKQTFAVNKRQYLSVDLLHVSCQWNIASILYKHTDTLNIMLGRWYYTEIYIQFCLYPATSVLTWKRPMQSYPLTAALCVAAEFGLSFSYSKQMSGWVVSVAYVLDIGDALWKTQ